MKKQHIFSLLLVPMLLLSACAQTSVVDDLTGSHWELQSIHGDSITLLSYGELTFHDGGLVSGEGGCNTFRSSYQSDSATGSISFSTISSTKMVCGAGANMQIETEYFAALNAAQSYQIQGDTLTISGGEVLEFTRAH